MSESKQIHVLFHVPEGLEFIAVKDIEASLTNDHILHLPKYSYEPKTGRVHLFCTVSTIDSFKFHLQNAQILSVYSVTLVASESVIPTDIFAQVQPTFDFISDQTKQAPWYNVLQEDPHDASTSVSFRATFKKEQIRHKAPSQEIAGYIGFAFSDFFKHWKVKMTEFTYEIVSLWFQSSDKEVLHRVEGANNQSVILLLGVSIPIQDQRQRNRVYVGRTSLNPCIAYCLAMASDPKPGQVILDMCCGTGTIPIEGASRFKDVFWLGSEVKVKTLTEKALGNVQHSEIKNVDLLLSDARELCFRDASIDTIVSDWPWGLRENSFTQIQGLYPKFMKQMYRVLRRGGKAYIVTQGHKLMNRVLAYDWCKKQWNVDEVLSIGIGGYDVYLYILTKHVETV